MVTRLTAPYEAAGERLVIGSPAFQPGNRVRLAFAQKGYDPVNVFNQEGFSLRPFVRELMIPVK